MNKKRVNFIPKLIDIKFIYIILVLIKTFLYDKKFKD